MDDLTRIQPVKRTSFALRSQKDGVLYALAGEMLIGREFECDIQLSVPQVSRYHAKIYVATSGVYIEDLQSSNGTFVNGRRIQTRTHLSLGDHVSFDDVAFRVTSNHSSDADSTRLGVNSAQANQAGSTNAQQEKPENRNSPQTKEPKEDKQLGDVVLHPSSAKLVAKHMIPPEYREEYREFSADKARGDNADERQAGEGTSDDASPQPSMSGDHAHRDHKVHPMPDLQELLDFAASGLHAQRELSKEESNPFRRTPPPSSPSSSMPLEEKLEEPQVPDASLGAQKRLVNDELPPLRTAQEDAAQEFMGDRESGNSDAVNIASGGIGEDDIKRAYSDEINHLTDSVPPSPEDDDKTEYIGLNTLDSYAATNEKYQQVLNVGSGPRFVAMTAPIRGKVFQLASDEDVKCWSIGRDDSADICLRDATVSREHAWITKLDALYQLRINDSASNIIINGRSCAEADLKHGDRLQFGTMELVFRLDEITPSNDVLNTGKISLWAKLWRNITSRFK